MAIPGIPQNFYVQTANGQNLISWDLSPGATSYIVQKSLDNITYTTLATVTGSPLATQYLDSTPTLGTQYWYQVAAIGTSGTSSYTTPQSVVPVPTGEMCLSQIRLAAMQRADRVNSNFVTMPEWRSYINQAMFELYDLLITVYEDLYVASPVQFMSDGNTFLYPLPNGSNTFQNGLNPSQTLTPRPFYKLLGVDQAVNSAPNAYITLTKFNFINRNDYIFPNSSSSLYGVFNPQYRLLGNNIEFIPTPSANQQFRIWYIPRLKELLMDTDTTDTGVSGWIEYVIVRAAKYALDKEEADTSKLDTQILFLKARIEESATNRDVGQPDTISDTRSSSGWGNNGRGGFFGSSGGF